MPEMNNIPTAEQMKAAAQYGLTLLTLIDDLIRALEVAERDWWSEIGSGPFEPSEELKALQLRVSHL